MDNYKLNKIQRALLFMAVQLDKICKENNINYSVDSGTMIGIVRHKGFIPWDDDIDVHMLRKDYIKFIDLVEKNIDSRFGIINWDNTENYYHGHAKFVLKGSEVLQSTHVLSDESRELFIDIFPYDNAPKSHIAQIKQKWVCYFYNKAIVLKGNFKTHASMGSALLNNGILILTKNLSRKQLIDRINRYSQQYNGKNTELVAYMTGGKNGYEHTLSQECEHIHTKYMAFENTQLLCSINYDHLLTIQFDDYMKIPPVECRVNHNMELKRLPEYLEDI